MTFSRRVLIQAAAALVAGRALPSLRTTEPPKRKTIAGEPAGVLVVYARGGTVLIEAPVVRDPDGTFRCDAEFMASGTPCRFVWAIPGGATLFGSAGVGPGHDLNFDGVATLAGHLSFRATVIA